MTSLLDRMVGEAAGQLWWSPDDAPPAEEAKVILGGSLPVLAAHVAAHASAVLERVTCPQDCADAVGALAGAVAEVAGAPLEVSVDGRAVPEGMIHAGAAALQTHGQVTVEADKAVLVLRAAMPVLAEQIRAAGDQASRRDPGAGVRAAVSQVTDLAARVRPY